LPGEDYTSFAESYNRVYALNPQHLQLGFLKLLKGTLLRENAEALGVSAAFLQSDMFTEAKGMRFDVIACNPPYLTADDMERLQAELRAEPRAALYGGIDGLDFYRRAASELGSHLTRRGAAFFEVGMGQAADVAELLRPIGSVTIGLDLHGIERVVSVVKAV
jgi:release factor glutamine methyltransferase